MQLHELEFLLH